MSGQNDANVLYSQTKFESWTLRSQVQCLDHYATQVTKKLWIASQIWVSYTTTYIGWLTDWWIASNGYVRFNKQALSTFTWGGASKWRKNLRTVGPSFEINKKDLNMYLFYQNELKACYHCTLTFFSCGLRSIKRFDTKKV